MKKNTFSKRMISMTRIFVKTLTMIVWFSPVYSQTTFLTINGTYTGFINGMPIIGTSTGTIDVSGRDSSMNNVIRTFSQFPVFIPFVFRGTGTHPLYDLTCREIPPAKNLYSLSGGNYSVVKIYKWPNYPSDSLIVTSAVSTVGNVLTYSSNYTGTYTGPTDSITDGTIWDNYQIVTQNFGMYIEGGGTFISPSGSHEVITKEYYTFQSPISTEQRSSRFIYYQSFQNNVMITRWSNRVWVSQAGINAIDDNYNILIYPSPTSSHITIENITRGDLSILNLNGQQLLQQEIIEPITVIDVSILPSGIYMVKLDGIKGVQVGKIIKK